MVKMVGVPHLLKPVFVLVFECAANEAVRNLGWTVPWEYTWVSEREGS